MTRLESRVIKVCGDTALVKEPKRSLKNLITTPHGTKVEKKTELFILKVTLYLSL